MRRHSGCPTRDEGRDLLKRSRTPALPLRFATADPRADGGRRMVELSAATVMMERVIAGVRMRVELPVATFRGIALEVTGPAVHVRIRLVHEDRDLDLVLFEAATIAT